MAEKINAAPYVREQEKLYRQLEDNNTRIFDHTRRLVEKLVALEEENKSLREQIEIMPGTEHAELFARRRRNEQLERQCDSLAREIDRLYAEVTSLRGQVELLTGVEVNRT